MEKENKLKVLIISDDYELEKQITATLSGKGCYEIAENPYVTIIPGSICFSIKPEILLLCITLPNTDTDRKIAEFRARLPGTSILLITDISQFPDLNDLYRIKADGLLLRDELEKIDDAVRTIVAGKRYINQCLMDCMLQNMIGDTFSDTFGCCNNSAVLFPVREKQVHRLLLEGYSAETIAGILKIKPDEVSIYVNRLDMRNNGTESGDI